MEKKELFTSRWGIIFAGLGMAIGTGNIWRFPRMVSQYGGSAFIISWLLFILLWAIPLLVIEISIGKKTRLGVIGAFGKIAGKKFTWMGTFVAFVTTAIMFYYSVITGWCLKYFFAASFQGLIKKNPLKFWNSFTSSWEPAIFHFAVIGIGALIIYRGVVKGIERVNKVLIPALFLIMAIACIRVLSLPDAFRGLNFLFSPDFSKLADYKVWLNALSQSVWSVGGGWGLILTYSVYIHKKENPLRLAATIGIGDILASLMAATAVIPTVFSYFYAQDFSHQKVLEVMKVDDQGLTFIWMPNLFSKIPTGSLFLALFFLALSFASFSSLIAMLELDTRILMDTGLTRKKAVKIVAACGFIFGLPSALSMKFFNNQDWVWGLGLIVSGFFFTIVVLKFGVKKFRQVILPHFKDHKILGKTFDILIAFFLPVQFLAVISWWFWKSYSADPHGWLNIFSSSSVGTALFQWLAALAVFIFLNKTINRKTLRNQ